MNNANTILSILSLFTMSASICMVKPTALPVPDSSGFCARPPVRPTTLLGLAIEEVFKQVDEYIKSIAAEQIVDPVLASTELFTQFIPEVYFEDCLKKRVIAEYAIKPFDHEGNQIRFYDGRLINARILRLANPTFKNQLKRISPLIMMTSPDLVAHLIAVEHAKKMDAAYPH